VLNPNGAAVCLFEEENIKKTLLFHVLNF